MDNWEGNLKGLSGDGQVLDPDGVKVALVGKNVTAMIRAFHHI